MIADDLIQQAAQMIRSATNIAVLTGAGVSKESGIPTFRDAMDGLWSQFDPTQLATPIAFMENPKRVWDFYQYRRDLMRPAQPNPGHYALAELERRYPGLFIITQNVDDLHERAGSKNIIRLHGSIAQDKCFYNCQGDPTIVDVSQIAWDKESGPPPCPHCGRWLRPAVVWFGEILPVGEFARAREVLLTCDVMLVIGTSGLVSPAADMPRAARDHGAKIIEINPDYSMITRIAHLKLEGPSGEILPRVLAALDA